MQQQANSGSDFGLLYAIWNCWDIKDEKIWIQYDGTEYSIAQELIDLGVPSQSIVVAYHAPYSRKFTEFAVG
jgi:XisI protein